jgi:hypothetical protein
MAKWDPVDPNEVPNDREPHRGRVSYPLLKSFLETGLPVACLDRTGIQQSLMSLNSCLGAYIKSHGLPIKIFQRRGQIYAARTDLDDLGRPDPSNSDIRSIERPSREPGVFPGAIPVSALSQVRPIDDAEVAARYGVEKDRVTK